MDFVNLILGFLVGILSSYAFWAALSVVKPNIEISPFVVFDPKNGSMRVRIRNKGRRQAVDIKVLAGVDEVMPNKFRRSVHKPSLRNDYRFALEPKHKDMDLNWGLPTVTTFVIPEGQHVLDLLAPSQGLERRLLFTLSATDALSGAKVVQRVSYTYQDIKQGEFQDGFGFEVIEAVSNDLVEAPNTEK